MTKPVTASRLRVPLEIALGMHGNTLKEHRETEISSPDYEVLESAGLRILLTEDNIINSKVMAKLLRCIGCSNILFSKGDNGSGSRKGSFFGKIRYSSDGFANACHGWDRSGAKNVRRTQKLLRRH